MVVVRLHATKCLTLRTDDTTRVGHQALNEIMEQDILG